MSRFVAILTISPITDIRLCSKDKTGHDFQWQRKYYRPRQDSYESQENNRNLLKTRDFGFASLISSCFFLVVPKLLIPTTGFSYIVKPPGSVWVIHECVVVSNMHDQTKESLNCWSWTSVPIPYPTSALRHKNFFMKQCRHLSRKIISFFLI